MRRSLRVFRFQWESDRRPVVVLGGGGGAERKAARSANGEQIEGKKQAEVYTLFERNECSRVTAKASSCNK